MPIIKNSVAFKANIPCQYCLLMRHNLLRDIDQKEFDLINLIIEHNYFLEEEKILTDPIKPFKYLYTVGLGSLKEYSISIHGEERIIDFYLPGEIIGLDAISQKKYNYPTITLEKSIVCRIPFSKLLDLCRNRPTLQDKLLSFVSKKLLDRTTNNNHKLAEKRIAAFLINLSRRLSTQGNTTSYYQLSMSRYDIGSYLNLATETVSRVLTKFKNRGIVVINKKHILLNKPYDLMKLSYRVYQYIFQILQQ